MTKAYVISLTTAIALGYAGGFATNGLTAKAGHERPAQTMVQKSYQTSLPAVTGIWNQTSAVGCSEADNSLDMDPGTCAGKMAPCSPGTVLALTCNADGTTGIAINFAFDGFWSPAQPQ